MDSSYKFQAAEKAKYHSSWVDTRIITTLFRFLEAFVLVIVLYRLCSSHFDFSLKLLLSTQLSFSTVSLMISPRSVFVVGNVIVIALLLISGQIKGGKGSDFYDEYVEKCRNNNIDEQQTWCKEKEESDAYKVLSRTHSAHVERSKVLHVRNLRRSKSDQYHQKKAAVEAEMSGEQFRLTVEAFIARHKCCLREEEEISA